MSDAVVGTHFSELFSEDALAWNLREGYVNVQASNDERFYIYNYSKTCVIAGQWNNVTMRCRGLILHAETGMVAARPFPKFFNVSEYNPEEEMLFKPFRVIEKMDGSLGICYLDRHKPKIATRGSFTSTQAFRANHILKEKYPHFLPDTKHTFLFEIIYPSNRVVVDYGDLSDLILLGVVEIESGKELDIHSQVRQIQLKDNFGWDGPIVKEVVLTGGDYYHLKPEMVTAKYGVNDGTEEGFVLAFSWPPGYVTRAKVKHSEYVRLHHLMTNLSSKDIWVALMAGMTLEELHAEQTAEVREWITELYESIRNDFLYIKELCYDTYDELCADLTQRGLDDRNPTYSTEYAKKAVNTLWPAPVHNIFKDDGLYMANMKGKKSITDMRAFLFMIKDGKGLNESIWKMLEPIYFQPFDDDGVVEEDVVASETFIG